MNRIEQTSATTPIERSCASCSAMFVVATPLAKKNKIYCSSKCRTKKSTFVAGETKICLWCKQYFTANALSIRVQIYCKQQCRVYAKRKRANPNHVPTPIVNHNPQCARCGVNFTPHPKAAGRHKHCSVECSTIADCEKRKQQRRSLRQGTSKVCVYCSKDFEPSRRDRKTCSELCSKELAKKRAHEYAIKNTMPKGQRLTKECVWCGDDYLAALATSKHCNIICRKEDNVYLREEKNAKTLYRKNKNSTLLRSC